MWLGEWSKQTACIDISWKQNEACISNRVSSCRLQVWPCDVHGGGETEQTSKGIPPLTRYLVVQLISRANACRYHQRVNWKRQTESWNLTLIDETSSVFSKHTSKPRIAHSQFRRGIRIPHTALASAVGLRGDVDRSIHLHNSSWPQQVSNSVRLVAWKPPPVPQRRTCCETLLVCATNVRC